MSRQGASPARGERAAAVAALKSGRLAGESHPEPQETLRQLQTPNPDPVVGQPLRRTGTFDDALGQVPPFRRSRRAILGTDSADEEVQLTQTRRQTVRAFLRPQNPTPVVPLGIRIDPRRRAIAAMLIPSLAASWCRSTRRRSEVRVLDRSLA